MNIIQNQSVFDFTLQKRGNIQKLKELYENTLEKDKLIRKSGYNLVLVWEKDYYDYNSKFRISWENNEYKIIIDE